jgi:hypothetical protein
MLIVRQVKPKKCDGMVVLRSLHVASTSIRGGARRNSVPTSWRLRPRALYGNLAAKACVLARYGHLPDMPEIEAIACTGGFGETFPDDYGAAIVHVVWERKKSQRTLLLAWVELLPREISPPDDDEEACTRIQDRYVYVRHVVTTADRALRWYRDCARGVAVRPANDGSLPEPAPDAGTLAWISTGRNPHKIRTLSRHRGLRTC